MFFICRKDELETFGNVMDLVSRYEFFLLVTDSNTAIVLVLLQKTQIDRLLFFSSRQVQHSAYGLKDKLDLKLMYSPVVLYLYI